MQILIILIWILLISCCSFFGSYYAKKYNKPDMLIGLYVAFVIISNIVAYKTVEFDLYFFKIYAVAATLIFSVTFLITDIVNEKFGRKETQKMIFIAFITQIVSSLFIILAISLKPASFWGDQESFSRILGFTPRIMFASWVAFLISENMDAYLFSWFKKRTNGKYLWMRNAFSSLPSMVLDTGIFVIIAFSGVQPLLPLFIGICIIKWLVGIINIPFMYINRKVMFNRK
jgi:uncharacterized integral membrane protein (TIGR00697 family)